MSAEDKIVEVSDEQIPEGSEVSVISKDEKKARALISKLGLKEVPGISRVTFRRRGEIVAIENPSVYKSPAGSYVVFGEAKVEDLAKRYEEAAAAEAAAAAAGGAPKDADSITADLQASALEREHNHDHAGHDHSHDDEDDGEVDLTGLVAEDVDIVVDQAHCSKSKAAKALREHSGDVINAIMSLV
ncbi:unnamed protein product [Kuraishia capsulata CBS 1993]|uniref:Nascent polypeptide-associated complex subunit alpha n=1 Tax=Kuraishia capsulata CBS 1993 TaxID=1382522 RepID=W6MQD7_9ASCO|nr:uncharacterized protein KUCA_T00004950001 [Kuraishia capsulata CBS 1993]CDK28964.1 unnamed protein product [Kuraishia capsulata CBS 1993]